MDKLGIVTDQGTWDYKSKKFCEKGECFLKETKKTS